MGSYRKVLLDRTGPQLGCFYVQLDDEDALAAKGDFATALVSRPLRRTFMWRVQNHKHSILKT